MQIIDDKGRIFGIINIIDLTVLLFILLAGMTFYKYVILQDWPVILNKTIEKFSPVPKEPIYVQKEITLQLTNTSELINDNLKVGLKSYGKDDAVAAIITEISSIVKKDNYDITFKINAKLQKKRNNLFLMEEDNPIKLENKMLIPTEFFDIRAKVLAINDVKNSSLLD